MTTNKHYFHTIQKIDREEFLNKNILRQQMLIKDTIVWFDFEVDIKYRYEGLVLFYPTEWKVEDTYDGFEELILRKKICGIYKER